MRTIMDLKQLRYFMAIVEERQITAAARRLHMAQPPLSNQMKMLEDEIGLKLFQRGPHHIELTEAGELLAARAAQLLDMAAMTKRELKDFRQGLCGTLAIGTVSSSGGILMHEGMQVFRAEFPRVHFEIHDGNTYQLIDMLDRRIIEIAIVRTPFNAARFNCKYRQPEPMIAAMTSELDWAPEKQEIAVEELAEKSLILYAASSNCCSTPSPRTTSRQKSPASTTMRARQSSGPMPASASPSHRPPPSSLPPITTCMSRPSRRGACRRGLPPYGPAMPTSPRRPSTSSNSFDSVNQFNGIPTVI